MYLLVSFAQYDLQVCVPWFGREATVHHFFAVQCVSAANDFLGKKAPRFHHSVHNAVNASIQQR